MTDVKSQPKRVTRRRTPEPVEPVQEEPEPEEAIQFEIPMQEPQPKKDVVKKPGRSLFRRGSDVLCLVITPGERTPELLKLRKTENIITDKHDDRAFIVSTHPALRIRNRSDQLDCYVLDAEKGCTVDLSFVRDSRLAQMHTNPETTYDLIDQAFISQFIDLKPDWKSQLTFGLFIGLIAFLVGLMF